mmetsp:Transcript_35948/g.66014  ORF Transcript_35948/g.66014 Transcript_35948/m.66014 type:complete len:257 (+) Transcript_35948:77-847(+)
MKVPSLWHAVSFEGTEGSTTASPSPPDPHATSLEESNEGPLKAVYGVVKDIEDFQKEHLAYKASEGKQHPLPKSFDTAWQAIWDRRDSLNKVKDRLYQCRSYENALVGPQPGNMTDGQADQEAMQNSLASKVDDTLDATKKLLGEVDKAQVLLGATEKTGLADQVNRLLEHMQLAMKPLDNMMLGSGKTSGEEGGGTENQGVDEGADKEDFANEEAMPFSPVTSALVCHALRVLLPGPRSRRPQECGIHAAAAAFL